MEVKSNIVQAPMTPNITSPVPQPAAPQIQMPATPSNSSNKVILWFVVGLVIIVLVVGGFYFFLSRQQATQTQAPITQVSPSPSTQQNLESDLNNINIDASGAASDFTAVDQDLQQL